MAKQSGLGDRFYLGGIDLSGDVGAIDNLHGGPSAQDMTGIDKSGFERVGGLKDSAIEWSSWFNPTNAHAQLSTLPTTSRVATYLRGLGLGVPGAGLVAKQLNYDPKRAADGTLQLAVSCQGSDGFPLDWGVQATPGVRTDTTATNGATLDNGTAVINAGVPGATPYGAVAYLHVLGLTGTTATVTVQHSTDGTTWSTLAAFAAATAVGAQRVEVAGAVNRYVRAISTGTFTSFAHAVLVCRREAAA
jgi:hypothetical protein